MRKNILKIALLTIAAILTTSYTTAQTSAAKKVSESVFTLTTFKKDGSLLASSHGVFTNNGEAISNLSPFIGADKAVVIDSKGGKHNVTRILGLNGIYDVVRFKIDGHNKYAPIAKGQTEADAKIWLVPYATKSVKPLTANIKSIEKFMSDYSYYIFSFSPNENTEGCPFVNENGEVIGLLQSSTINEDIHATDAKFTQSLKTTGLSVNDENYRKIGIPAALPEEKEQAVLALMLTEQLGDSAKCAATSEDFIKSFPDLIDGYAAKAQLEVNANDFDKAKSTMDKALSEVKAKEDAHYNYAKIIYLKEIYKTDIPYAQWNLDKALNEITNAYTIRQLPVYKDLEGQILFAKGDFNKAYDVFMGLTNTNLKNGDLLYNAALCKQQLKAPDTEILALLDSAVNNADTINIYNSAKYYQMRAEVYNRAKNYRQAVFDMTRYEIACGGRVNAEFYYNREQLEVKAKLFKQALTDIDNAIFLDTKEPTYIAEKASLQMRLNLFTDAMKTAQKCIDLAPDYSDAYLILGISEIKTGNKTDGLRNLNKAKDMGNSQARSIIEKYSK